MRKDFITRQYTTNTLLGVQQMVRDIQLLRAGGWEMTERKDTVVGAHTIKGKQIGGNIVATTITFSRKTDYREE